MFLPKYVPDPPIRLPKDVIDDIYSKFLIHHDGGKTIDYLSLVKDLQKAHWYYKDEIYMKKQSELPKVDRLTTFVREMIKEIGFLKYDGKVIFKNIEKWREIRRNLPSYGIIILNADMTKVIMLKNNFLNWTFPGGKAEPGESPEKCAQREVEEEIGISISSDKLDNADKLDITIECGKRTVLFIVQRLSEILPPKPKHYETMEVEWRSVSSLPNDYDDQYHNVHFFVGPLKSWISQNQRMVEDSE